MSHTVERVESEWQRQSHLGQHLQEHGPRSEAGRNGCGLKVPSESWSNQVQSTECVEGTADRAACDTVQGGEVPCDLWFVDGEVRGDGAVETLLSEDCAAGFVGGDLGAGGHLSVWEEEGSVLEDWEEWYTASLTCAGPC